MTTIPLLTSIWGWWEGSWLERPGYGNRQGRQVMYRDAARLFEYLNAEKIVREKVVPYPKDLVRKPFPWR